MNYEDSCFQDARHDLNKSIRRMDLISESMDEFIEAGTPMADRVIRDMEEEVKKISDLWSRYNNLLKN